MQQVTIETLRVEQKQMLLDMWAKEYEEKYNEQLKTLEDMKILRENIKLVTESMVGNG